MSIFKIGTAESRRLNYHQFSGKSVWTWTFAPVVRRAALISRTQREQFCRIVACSLPLLQLKCATSFAVHCCSLDLSEATRHWSRVPSEQANWTHCQTPFCKPRILTKHNKKQKYKQCCCHSFVFNCPAPSQEPLNRMRRSLVLHSYQFVDPKPLPLCCPERNISKSIKRVTGFGCEEKERAENKKKCKHREGGRHVVTESPENIWIFWHDSIFIFME